LLEDKSLSTEKVKEEIAELIKAVENNSNKIHEAADVLYHLIVYLEANGIKIEDVMEELNKRKK
jgi:phosphoribosyl-ATP pyrophosphohydrolase